MVRQGYENALELFEQGYFKSARLELKPGLKLLERRAIASPILEKYYILLSEIYQNLDDPGQSRHYADLAGKISDRLRGPSS